MTNSKLKTRRIATAKNLRFPEFTNKRKVNGSKFYVNKNVNKKYKIIVGLYILIDNKFDFLLSIGMIEW